MRRPTPHPTAIEVLHRLVAAELQIVAGDELILSDVGQRRTYATRSKCTPGTSRQRCVGFVTFSIVRNIVTPA